VDPQLRRPCRARDADPTERPPIGTHPLVAVALSIAERRGLPGKPRQIGTGQHPLPRVGSPHRDGDLTPRIASQPARLTAASPVRGLSGLSSPVAQSDAVRRDRAHFRRCDRRALPLVNAPVPSSTPSPPPPLGRSSPRPVPPPGVRRHMTCAVRQSSCAGCVTLAAALATFVVQGGQTTKVVSSRDNRAP